MGTWGARNLESDCALDIISDESHDLVKEIIELAASESAAEYDQYEHTLLFVKFEQFFALNQHGLITWFPPAEEVSGLNDTFIQRWKEYREEEWPEREQVIAETFDRFVSLCHAEEERVENLPPINVFEPPAMDEVLDGKPCKSQTLLDEYSLETPVDWTVTSVDPAELPGALLLSELRDVSGLKLDMTTWDGGNWKLEIRECCIASGLSLESDTVPPGFDPYILVAKLVGPANNKDCSYNLTFAADSLLRPNFDFDGQFVGGPCGSIENDFFDFIGLASFRHIGELRMERELHFHKISDTEVLVLEIGGCQDNSDERKDKWLVEGLSQTLRPIGH